MHVRPACATTHPLFPASGPIADVFDEAMDIQSDMIHKAQEEKRDAELAGRSADADAIFGDGGAAERRASQVGGLIKQRTSALFPVQLKQGAPGGDAVMRALRRGLTTSNAEAQARSGAGRWAVLGGSLKKVRD